MNVLILTTHLNFGGITSYVLNLSAQLKKEGHNVFVGSSGGDLKERLQASGIAHFDLDIKTKSELSPKVIFSFLKLKKILRAKNIQVIHAQTRVTQVLAYLLSKALNIPYVTTCHGYFKLRWGRKAFGFWGERVIAISEAVRKHLTDDFKLPRQQVKLVYNGVEIRPKKEFDLEELKKKFGLKDVPIVGIVARLSGVKGHKYLIEAMRYVTSTRADVQLLIVGDGPSKQELFNLVDKLYLKENVVFLPPRENLEEIFSLMSVYASPSVQEGLGLSILEAQANLVPVAAFASGGIKDVIKHEVTGLLVEPFAVKELAGAILRLILDTELSEEIKKSAYAQLVREFSTENMAKETIGVYREALG